MYVPITVLYSQDTRKEWKTETYKEACAFAFQGPEMFSNLKGDDGAEGGGCLSSESVSTRIWSDFLLVKM